MKSDNRTEKIKELAESTAKLRELDTWRCKAIKEMQQLLLSIDCSYCSCPIHSHPKTTNIFLLNCFQCKKPIEGDGPYFYFCEDCGSELDKETGK